MLNGGCFLLQLLASSYCGNTFEDSPFPFVHQYFPFSTDESQKMQPKSVKKRKATYKFKNAMPKSEHF
jgi:hypothetical protein